MKDGWHAANDGAGARIWFLLRYAGGRPVDYLFARNGKLIKFSSYKNAAKRADELNRERL